MGTTAWIILAAIVVIVIIVIAAYNSLVRGRNSVRAAWSQVETQLQRRLDLIPNLVETVRGYANHESDTLKAVSEARTAASSALTDGDMGRISRTSDHLMASINAVGEAYPDLKADANFRRLQSDLVDTENVIAAARRLYNNEVNDYNTSTQSFPKNIIASMFGFKPFDMFEADKGAEQAPKVSFQG